VIFIQYLYQDSVLCMQPVNSKILPPLGNERIYTNDEPSLLPSIISGSHLVLSVLLTLLVGRSILRSYIALPPSSATRHRQPARKSHVKKFAGLAAVSLLFASYWGFAASDLSYRVWADQRGVELPDRYCSPCHLTGSHNY